MLCKSDRCFYMVAVMSTWCGYYTLLLRGSKYFADIMDMAADGTKSHPCSIVPRCHILVAALPDIAKILRASNQLRSCIHIQADIAAKIKLLQSEVVKRKHRMHLISCNPTSSVIHFQTLQVPRKTKVFGEEETECSRPSTRKTRGDKRI